MGSVSFKRTSEKQTHIWAGQDLSLTGSLDPQRTDRSLPASLFSVVEKA